MRTTAFVLLLAVLFCVPWAAQADTIKPLKKVKIKNIKDVVTRYYLRFSVVDCTGVLSKISGILGRHNISIHSVIQKGRRVKGVVSIFLLTHEARDADVRKALNEIDRLSVVQDKTMLIRIEDL